ncbi:Uncharacterized protein dnm_004950 [Desulfonema magnum]|uniref:Uncharacterized protein n=2 Tax=Desulfonema magnum TaxID=45655 RepID=A0A975BFT3_9BACT|nr:Uncharacterized protein dnm_004950 [Desulfonema magnum]
MTLEDYEQLFEESQKLDNIDFINIEFVSSVAYKHPAYIKNIYGTFETGADIIDHENIITDYERSDTYIETEMTLLIAA